MLFNENYIKNPCRDLLLHFDFRTVVSTAHNKDTISMNNPLVPKVDHGCMQCDAEDTKGPLKLFAKTCTKYWVAIQIPGLWHSTMAMNSISKGLYNACSYTKTTAILRLRYSLKRHFQGFFNTFDYLVTYLN